MTSTISYSYQWRRDSTAIPGATGPTYTLRDEDRACVITCTVTAHTSAGSTGVTTAPALVEAGIGGTTVPFPVGIAIGDDPPVLYGPDHGLAQYESIRSYGFTTARIDAGYQPNGPSGNDATIRAALAAGLDVLILLDGYDVTIGPLAFGEWCRYVATTYGPLGVHHYEVLNEENYYSNWDRSPAQTVSAIGYATLLREAYAAIKAADSAAVVLLGGMACVGATDGAALGGGSYDQHLLPTTFISLVYDALGGSSAGAFDAVAVHPYTFPNVPGTPGDNFMNNLAPSGTTVRTIMVDNGDEAKPIWVTEFGSPTVADSTELTEAAQVNQLSTALTLCAGWPHVGAFYVFNWNDDTNGDFGLVDAEYVAKPALATVVSYLP